MNEFGDYIRKIREGKRLTLNQVATYADISPAQLSRIENGKRGVPKPTTIKKIADALKVDYNELMKVAGYLDESTVVEEETLIDINNLEELLKDKVVTVGDRILTDDEKVKAIKVLRVMFEEKKK